MQGLIMKHHPEKRIKRYVESDFAVGWNEEEGKYLGLVLSIMGYGTTYNN